MKTNILAIAAGLSDTSASLNEGGVGSGCVTIEGNLFNTFIWGGYLLLAWPEQRVFIDGGTDHYGDTLFSQYIQVWNLDPGWQDVLRSHGIDLAIEEMRYARKELAPVGEADEHDLSEAAMAY